MPFFNGFHFMGGEVAQDPVLTAQHRENGGCAAAVDMPRWKYQHGHVVSPASKNSR